MKKETVIARNEAIFDRKVGDLHVEDCHAIARNDGRFQYNKSILLLLNSF
jgi:hypothetical protein